METSRGRWIDQLWRDNNRPPADQWKLAIKHGHGGRAMLRSHNYATTWPDLSTSWPWPEMSCVHLCLRHNVGPSAIPKKVAVHTKYRQNCCGRNSKQHSYQNSYD